MKKVFQPNVRKVYATQQESSQMTAVRKIHNLLSSGAVTVTGPTQPRILKQKIGNSTIGGGGSGTTINIHQQQSNATSMSTNQQQHHQNVVQQQLLVAPTPVLNTIVRCYVCDDPAGNNCTILNETCTASTNTKLPNKIGQIIGDAFMVVINVDDVLCKRCTTMINHLDRLETDIERVKTNIMNFLYKKYNLSTDDDDKQQQTNATTTNNTNTNNSSSNYSTVNNSLSTVATTTLSPPVKMQKLNTGSGINNNNSGVINRRLISGNLNNVDDDNLPTRKINIHNIQSNRDPIENQLSTLFESGGGVTAIDTKPTTIHTSAVQQIKILSPQLHMQQQQAAAQQQQSVVQHQIVVGQQQQVVVGQQQVVVGQQQQVVVGQQQVVVGQQQVVVGQQQVIVGQQRQLLPKRGPIKIYKCMSCDFKTTDLKQFQPHYETCRDQSSYNCKFCKKLFPNATLLRQHVAEKHTTIEHSCPICINKFINELSLRKHIDLVHPDYSMQEPTASQLFSCNLCNYMTSDKPNYEEHLKKHTKVKPFKCRLCSTRFETREQASIHAKSHQPNYFKCGTCSASFTQRELLVKHFETHQNVPGQQQQSQPTQQIHPLQQPKQLVATVAPQRQQQHHQTLTTQKLLQATIDEALRENDHVETKGIHFFSCNICSLTFIQENYYNQHMDTHKKDNMNNKKPMIAAVSANLVTGNLISTATVASVVSAASVAVNIPPSQSLIRQEIRNTNLLTTTASSGSALQTTNVGGNGVTTSSISEADIESIFEKIHSDKSENDGSSGGSGGNNAGGTGPNENLVITTQENSVGGITFNITIPQPDNTKEVIKKDNEIDGNGGTDADKFTVGISMPVLDQTEDGGSHQQSGEGVKHENENSQGNADHHQQDNSQESTSNSSTVPVSMPSLEDEAEAAQSQQENDQQQQQHDDEQQQHEDDEQQQHEDQQQQEEQHEEHQVMNSDQVAMELEDMQNDGGQIKFILNENGEILHLDNHILTTDADGNQILVDGTDSEQIQQLLQSVGVLQSRGGLDGETTLQMIQGENNQMIIVQQGEDGHQLIDASMLNADGHLVIQQAQDDNEMQDDGTQHHQAHAIDEDGVRIPVSVAYTADGQQIVSAANSDHHHQHQQHQDNMDQHMQDEGHHEDGSVNTGTTGDDDGHTDDNITTTGQTTTTVSLTQAQATNASGEAFFALEELMQQSEQKSV